MKYIQFSQLFLLHKTKLNKELKNFKKPIMSQQPQFNKIQSLLKLLKNIQSNQTINITQLYNFSHCIFPKLDNAEFENEQKLKAIHDEFDTINGGLKFTVHEIEKEIQSIAKNYRKLNEDAQKGLSKNAQIIRENQELIYISLSFITILTFIQK